MFVRKTPGPRTVTLPDGTTLPCQVKSLDASNKC